MRIVFGHNHYCRKSVKLEELGIFTPLENIKHFELTQRYAHLYWIPLFPIGLSWNARCNDEKLYKINETLEQQLKHIHYSWASGLIAFIGPILILLGCLFYYLEGKYKEYDRQVRLEKEYEKTVSFIKQPTPQDYYHFAGSSEQYATVAGENDTALLLSVALVNPWTNEPTEVAALQKDSTRNIPQVWISKSTLFKMAKEKWRFDTALFDLGTFSLEEIKRLPKPSEKKETAIKIGTIDNK